MPMPVVGQGRAPYRGTTIAVDALQLVESVIDGRYLIEAVVGVGGFGVVYRAKHLRFDSTIAVKVLIRDNNGATPSTDTLLYGTEEGRLQFRLAALHPAFVRVFETGMVVCETGAQLPYIAMEWLEGLTLKAHVEALSKRGERVPLPAAMALLDDLVQALSLAHLRRVAHRDLKPANVFLAWNDGKLSPKILDFGLAKIGTNSENVYDDTLQQASPFTPAYAAPEQWDRSMGATGPWTDVYSFALILTELLIGRRWFSDHAEPAFARLTLGVTRPTPRALGATLDEVVDQVFQRALSVSPRERFATIGAFWESLAAASGWSRPSTPLRLEDYRLAVAPPGAKNDEESKTSSGETIIVVDSQPAGVTRQPPSGTRLIDEAKWSRSSSDLGTDVPASIQPSLLGASGAQGKLISSRRPFRSFLTLLVVATITFGVLLATVRARSPRGEATQRAVVPTRGAVAGQVPLPREPGQTLSTRTSVGDVGAASTLSNIAVGTVSSTPTPPIAPSKMAPAASGAKTRAPSLVANSHPRVNPQRANAAQRSSASPPSPSSLIMHDSLQTRK
jgi:serine/threonine protein kinase